MFRSVPWLTALVLSVLVVPVPSQAQTYPSQMVRIIAPDAAGGPGDIVARIVGQKLSDKWKQPVIVDNRAGAGGNIESDFVAKSPPDGHTLLVNTSAILISPLLGQKTGFDPINDLIPVAKIGVVPALLIVNQALEVKSVADLIAMAKAKPGALNFASPGAGTSLHLAAELFASMANVKLTHIPYKGGGLPLGTETTKDQ